MRSGSSEGRPDLAVETAYPVLQTIQIQKCVYAAHTRVGRDKSLAIALVYRPGKPFCAPSIENSSNFHNSMKSEAFTPITQ